MDAGAYVALKTEAIYDMASFHAECRRALGFPASYDDTLEAWVECMAGLRAGDGRVAVQVQAGEMLQLEIGDVDDLHERAPDVVESLVLLSAAVNQRYLAEGQAPALTLIFT